MNHRLSKEEQLVSGGRRPETPRPRKGQLRVGDSPRNHLAKGRPGSAGTEESLQVRALRDGGAGKAPPIWLLLRAQSPSAHTVTQ